MEARQIATMQVLPAWPSLDFDEVVLFRSLCCVHSAAVLHSRRLSTTMCGCHWTQRAALLQRPPWPMRQAARELLAMDPETVGSVLLLLLLLSII